MAIKLKSSGRAASMPMGIGIGILTSFIVTLLGTALLAYLIVGEHIGEGSTGYGVMMILVISSALGAWIASAKVKHRRALVCTLNGAGYYLLLLIVTVFFFGGEFTGMGISAIMVALGSLAGMLPFAQKKGRKNKYKIPAYR